MKKMICLLTALVLCACLAVPAFAAEDGFVPSIGYQDGPAIADYLVEGYTVVLNIEEIERQAALRLIDFLLGALQVLGGEFRRVTKTTLVLSPRSGDLAEEDVEEEEGELI